MHRDINNKYYDLRKSIVDYLLQKETVPFYNNISKIGDKENALFIIEENGTRYHTSNIIRYLKDKIYS